LDQTSQEKESKTPRGDNKGTKCFRKNSRLVAQLVKYLYETEVLLKTPNLLIINLGQVSLKN
jgi:hypothetical protein